MKYKTTRKAVVESCYNVKSASYCDLQSLLAFTSPDAYTCGVYGWNFDVYELDGLTICTGYRGMPGPRAEGISEYEEKARKILCHPTMDGNQKQEEIAQLLEEFIELNKLN